MAATASIKYSQRFFSYMLPEMKMQFDLLKCTSGRPGTELLEEAIGLLLDKHGRRDVKLVRRRGK